MYGIFTYIWLNIFMINVGKYISPMDAIWDAMGVIGSTTNTKALKNTGLLFFHVGQCG